MSVLDQAASLLYLVLPVLAVVTTWTLLHVQRPAVLEHLGPAEPVRWRARWVAVLLLVPPLAPILMCLAIVLWTRDWAADLTSLAAYTAVQVAWLWLTAGMSVAVARTEVGPRIAPVLAGLLLLLLIILAPSALYALGASLVLAGTTPVEATWTSSLATVVLASLVLAGTTVLGLQARPGRWSLLGVLLALVVVAQVLPGRTLQQASLPTECVATDPVVCSFPQYPQWRDVTAGAAARIKALATEERIPVAVSRIEQNAADVESADDGVLRVRLATRTAAASGVPPLELADAMLGPYTCYEQDLADSPDMDERRAVAHWLAAEANDDETLRRTLGQAWPQYASMDRQEWQSLGQRVATKITSCLG
ncbi:hypothetical protein [Ornithinimicrobium tianjinense]|uniref:hypothetical protein n=1 Tax=Ornithinimicrobium tianjinense TaxID=1195761 RepID=UPI0016645038|nr:hypothetical protein [Ornithinimicrobium tianjinense]